jgi:predicted Holliday junction resolvase-like endonuclease
VSLENLLKKFSYYAQFKQKQRKVKMREMNCKWLKMSNKLSLRGTDDVAFGELDEQFIREYMDFGFDP